MENGCLQYIPGSHRWDLLPKTGLAGDMAALRPLLDEQQWQQLQDPVPIEIRAGQCTFHHPLIIHGSYPNNSDRHRRATVLNVVRDGVRSKESLPLLEGANPVPAGTALSGRCYPLLSDIDSL